MLFPEDPTFPLLSAQISALDGNLPGAHATLGRLKGQLGERQVAAARALAKLLHQFRGLETRLAEPQPFFGLVVAEMPSLMQAWEVAQAFQGAQEEGAPALSLPLPPVLVKAYRPLAGLSLRMLLGRGLDQVIKALSDSVRVHPDALLYLALGLMLDQRSRP